MRQQRNMPSGQQPDLINLQEAAGQNYQIALRFIPTLLRTLGLTVAVFTRFHFGRGYIAAHTNAVLGVMMMTGGMGALLLLMLFSGFFNQPDSGLPLGVFLGAALLLSMLHRAVAFIRAWLKAPEPAMFPGKAWLALLLPVHPRWVYILIEPGLAFAIGFGLSRLNWPLGLWVMLASAMLAATGFVDVKTHLFSVLDARDAGTEGEIFTNDIETAKAPGASQPQAPGRFRVRANKA